MAKLAEEVDTLRWNLKKAVSDEVLWESAQNDPGADKGWATAFKSSAAEKKAEFESRLRELETRLAIERSRA